MTVDVIERMKLIEVAEQEVARRNCELEAKIKRPAEAEKYRLEVISAANKQKTVLEASAAAEAIALKGDAEALAIETKAKAEAERMALKADAWKEYQKAAKVSMWLEALPAIAAEVAAPLSQVNGVKMVAMTDQDAGLGPAKLTREVFDIMEKIPKAVEDMSGHKIKVI